MIVSAVALLVTVGIFNLIDGIAQMLFIPAYPFWSLLIIAIDVVALWGLGGAGTPVP